MARIIRNTVVLRFQTAEIRSAVKTSKSYNQMKKCGQRRRWYVLAVWTTPSRNSVSATAKTCLHLHHRVSKASKVGLSESTNPCADCV